MIDDHLAKEIGCTGVRDPLRLRWTDESSQVDFQSMRVDIEIQGDDQTCKHKIRNVRTIRNLSLTPQSVDVRKVQERWTHLRKIKIKNLVDAKPRILIGQDNCHLIVPREIIEGPINAPVLSRSLLGWSIHGNVGPLKTRVDEQLVFHSHEEPHDSELHKLIKDSFRTENFGVVPPRKPLVSMEEERAQKILESTTRKIGNRWETGLLWKSDDITMPESYKMALSRLLSVEKEMRKNVNFKNLYKDKIQEYVEKNYCRKLSFTEVSTCDPRTWYIPHFAVYNVNKPGKIRLVFDAAAKSN